MRVQRLRRRWLQQLQQWANCGELLQAAQRALQLERTPKALQELINRLAAGEQEQLPPIRVLSERPSVALPGLMPRQPKRFI